MNSNFPETVITLMRLYGMLPKENETLNFFFFLRSFLFFTPVTLFLVENCIYLLYNFSNPKVDVTENEVVVLAGVFCIYIIIKYFFKLKTIIQFVQNVANFEVFGIPPKFEKFKEYSNTTMKVLYGYCFICVFIYAAASYYQGLICEKKNIKENTRNLCGLLIPVWIPFSLENIYIKKLIFVLQMVQAHIGVLPVICATYFAAICIGMITLRLEHLKSILKTLDTKNMSNETRTDCLKWCIKYHQRIISLTRSFNDYFKSLNSVHFVLTALILGILNHQILKDWQLKAVLHHLGWVSSLFLICNAGQNIIDESLSMSETLYFIKWYDYEPKINFYIRMLMMRSQRQLHIVAGIFYSYSFEILLAILQASYTYMTMMNQIDKLKENF